MFIRAGKPIGAQKHDRGRPLLSRIHGRETLRSLGVHTLDCSWQRNSIQIPMHGSIDVRKVRRVPAGHEFAARDRLGSLHYIGIRQRLDPSVRKWGQVLIGPKRNRQASSGTGPRGRFHWYYKKPSRGGPGRNTEICAYGPRSSAIERNRLGDDSGALQDGNAGYYPSTSG
jgi:hypothetical protein